MQRPVLFQKLLGERHWGDYEVFRRRYEAAAKELARLEGPPSLATCTIGKRQFLRWAHGELEGTPRSDARRILEYLFQMPVAALFRPIQEVAVGDPEAAPAPDGTEHPGPTGQAPFATKDMVMEAAHESARFAARAERSNVGPHTLEQLGADIRRIVTTYPNRPVGPLFLEVKELRDRAFELLEGKQPPQYTKDLYLAAGTLCGVLANASFDLGRYDAAETQARAAFLCGELAGHNGLRAWVRGLQALIAYWDGRPQDAVRLAAAGRDFVPEEGTAHIRLASIEARAHGQMNNADEALSSLRRAEELRERADGPDIPGGMMSFPLAKQLYCASTTHLWLGGRQSLIDAEGHAEEAVALFEADAPEQRRLGELSLARMDLAVARLGRGDLEGTAVQVHTVLGVAARRRIESVSKRIEQFGRYLAVHPAASSQAALGLREAIISHNARGHAAALPPGAAS
ncbi:hypothetical protein RKE29_01320 [Streptomyces sp. B1866]|uniref:hypothetical protein n=1 Tax=Streptomyces sp. B1866 TaxID=3075431 RepID=UPI00288E7844|nr:hypothetical protein [Streptomyces sp. B1866]MDT3395301.1 hypothetical protein [Streptomyces sp. B1866]